MYSISSCFGEGKLKQKIQQGEDVSPMTDLKGVPESKLQPLQSVDRVKTFVCRYNDELVERIEFEVSSRGAA